MTETPQNPVPRLHWLDNLRTFMIFLVVALHSGLVYESSGIGASFWIVDDPATNHLSGLVNLVIDIFTMSAIFFVSGFLAPLSIRRNPGLAFLRSKLRRLMLPWLIAVLTLLPLYKVIFLYSRDLPQQSWTTYFHWSNGVWGMNWLWFLPVLFAFETVYWLLSKLKTQLPRLSLKAAIGLAFPIAFAYSFAIDLLRLQGWTKTVLVDFQNERLLIYFMVFLIGSLCFKLKTFESAAGGRKGLYFLASFTVWIPICLYMFMVIHFLMKPGEYIVSGIVDGLLVRFVFLVSLMGLLYVLTTTFRLYLDWGGGISQELNRNSYGVYIVHVVVMGGVALTMLHTGIPSIVRYALLVPSTYAASNLLVHAYRKAGFFRPANGRLGIKELELTRRETLG